MTHSLNDIQWRWISGTSVANSKSIHGQVGEFNLEYTPGGRDKTIMTTSKKGLSFVFAGFGTSVSSTGYLNDLWVYKQMSWDSLGEWAYLSGNSSVNVNGISFPGSRTGGIGWNINGDFYTHGGYGYDSTGPNPGYLNDLWHFDLTTKSWTLVGGSDLITQHASYGSKGVPGSNNVPGSVTYHTILADDRILKFGGFGFALGSIEVLSDVWSFNTSSKQWTWINGPSLARQQSIHGQCGNFSSLFTPGSRMQIQAVIRNNLTYVFGGVGVLSNSPSPSKLSDLWAYNVNSNQWACMGGELVTQNVAGQYGTMGEFSTQFYPGSRSQYAAWNDAYAPFIYIFGGNGKTSTGATNLLNDIFAFNVTSREFGWVGGDTTGIHHGSYADATWFSDENAPGDTMEMGAGLDDGLNMMYLFGGNCRGQRTNTLWGTRGVVAPVPRPTPTPTPMREISWRWLSGSSSWIAEESICGSAGEFDSSFTPGSRSQSALASDGDNFWLFGGSGPSTMASQGYLGDLWAYRLSDWDQKGQWAWMSGHSNQVDYPGVYQASSPRPGSRRGATLFMLDGMVHMFSGRGTDGLGGSGRLQDLWLFNSSSMGWAWLKGQSIMNRNGVLGMKGVGASANTPESLESAALLHSDDKGCSIGLGAGQYGLLSDVWHYRGNWTWMNGPGASGKKSIGGDTGVFDSSFYPGGRYQCAVMETDRVYVYGGYGYDASSPAQQRLADTWAFDLVLNQWAYITGESASTLPQIGVYGRLGYTSPSSHPGSRQGALGYHDPDSDLGIMLTGNGFAATLVSTDLADMWAWNGTTVQWVWISGSSVGNAPRLYDNSDWFSTTTSPGARTDAAGCSTASLMVLFGGLNANNDMLVFKGPTFVVGEKPTATPTPTPSPLPVQGVAWRWIGGSTSVQSYGSIGHRGVYGSSHVPGARQDFALAFDGSNTFYMIGGRGRLSQGDLGRLNEVWACRMASWSSRCDWAWLGGSSTDVNVMGQYALPDPQPGSMTEMLAWFAQPKDLYVFGGSGYTTSSLIGQLNDVWSFCTQTYTWTHLKGPTAINRAAIYPTALGMATTTTMPGSTSGACMLYSTSDGNMVYFGGEGYGISPALGGMLSDTWKYTPSNNQWTWINGVSTLNKASAGGASMVYSSSYHPGGRLQALIADETIKGKDTVYLFGGKGFTADPAVPLGGLSDLWVYSHNKWAYVTGNSLTTTDVGSYGDRGMYSSANHPGARYAGGGFAEPYSNLVTFYAGYGLTASSGTTTLNDYWSYNPSLNQWVWLDGASALQGTAVTDDKWFSDTNVVGGRYGFGCSSDGKVVLIVGGNGRAGGSTNILNDVWVTLGPKTAVQPSPTPTPIPTPHIDSSTSLITGTVVSAVFAAGVLGPTLIQNVAQKGDSGPLLAHIVDVFQFIAITGQLSMDLPQQYRDFAAGFSWTLPVIKAPFDFVPSTSRRLLATSLSQAFGTDVKQAALNYLPSLLFWIVVAFIIIILYIIIVDKIRVNLLGHQHDIVDFWRRSVGLFIRFMTFTYYALCYATFLALVMSLTHLGIFFVSIISLLGLCLAIPCLWSWVLYTTTPKDMQIVKNKALIGAFISGYKEERYWFSLVFLVHKFLTALLVAILTIGNVQTPLLVLLYTSMLLMLARYKPFVSRTVTLLWIAYTTLQIIELVVLFIVSFFVHSMDVATSTGVSVVVIVVNVVGACAVIAIALKSARGVFVRQKHEVEMEEQSVRI